jgi:hypothetical protein
MTFGRMMVQIDDEEHDHAQANSSRTARSGAGPYIAASEERAVIRPTSG